EPKPLTSDSVFKYTADISPDGSQVLFSKSTSRSIRFYPLETWTVSTLGGPGKKLADSTLSGRWSPDGKLIAYIGPRGAGGPPLWVMNSDGSNKHMVFSDTIGGPGGRVSMSWSPDGISIAWLRNFIGPSGKYQEIVIHNIETGKERQLTSDKKNIDEVCWTAKDIILFSSNRGGASNIWAIPADGGNPVQVTKGPGPDLGIQASRDGSRVLYLQQAEFGSIQIGDLSGLNARQITPDDQFVRGPQFSPDGKQIAYLVDDQDPIKPDSYLYVVDRDGRNRRQLATTTAFAVLPIWSPDGRQIAYSYLDSTWHVTGVDVADPTRKREIGVGVAIAWLRDGSALNVTRNQTSWRVPAQGGNEEIVYGDSTVVLSSPDGKMLAIDDARAATRGLWVKVKDAAPKVLVEGAVENMQWSPDGKSILFVRNDQQWVVSVETGKAQRYPWKNPEVVSFDDLSPDGKQTVFVKRRMNAKLILIENFQ
ncbi:MAG TPA: hypothetical protein VIH68_04320, partial [Bacteroidota bacterium]